MIHPTALVSPRARIGRDVSIGPFTVIHDAVEIGDGSVIEGQCELGHPAVDEVGPLVLGPGALIRSHSILYVGSTFGERLTTGHHVVIRDGVRAGANLQIGMGSDLQGDCVIGDYVRTQSQVIIGKASVVGSFVWLFPRVVLLNDPTPPSTTMLGATVRDFAVVCAHTAVLPGVTIGEGAVVGAMSNVTHSVPAHRIAAGNPLQDKGPTSRLKLRGSRQPAYPWTRHFDRGYPAEVVEGWAQQVAMIAA